MNGQAESENAHPGNLSVILLDDDDFTLEIVSEMLRSMGVSDIQAEHDGQQALLAIEQRHPNILICDLNMPNMDGIEFLRNVSEKKFSGGVILLSGMDTGVLQATQGLAIAQGLNILGVSKKPLRRDTLEAALARFDGGHAESKPVFSAAAKLTPDEVREGIDGGYVEVFFQPKVSINERRVIGAECLTRWRHPVRGLLGPDTFIPVVEEHGMIDDFTFEVFRKTARQMAAWQLAGYQFKIAINLSMINLNRLDLPDVFESILKDFGISATSIMLEITETRLSGDLVVTLEVITRLRLKGFGLSIDDFGTGYSTMENLKRMPFSELKIDRAFVNGAHQDAKARAILETSVGLGKTFNLNMVAEGVETQTDWDLVAHVGCHEVQGYFVAKPMPADEFAAWVERWIDENKR